jgi:hypothetical protein
MTTVVDGSKRLDADPSQVTKALSEHQPEPRLFEDEDI